MSGYVVTALAAIVGFLFGFLAACWWLQRP